MAGPFSKTKIKRYPGHKRSQLKYETKNDLSLPESENWSDENAEKTQSMWSWSHGTNPPSRAAGTDVIGTVAWSLNISAASCVWCVSIMRYEVCL